MPGLYDVGDTVRISAIFTDTANVTGDPTTVLLRWKNPAGTTGSAQYGTATAVVRQATGVYYYDTALGAAGTFWYRWQSTGSLPGAEEDWITVRQSKVI